MSLKLFSRNKPDSRWESHPGSRPNSSTEPESTHHPAPMEQLDEDPLMRLHQQGRNAIILRDEADYRVNPDGAAIVEKVKNELEQRMALVPDGSVSPDRPIDERVCDCCPTDALRAGDGAIIVVYRDRSRRRSGQSRIPRPPGRRVGLDPEIGQRLFHDLLDVLLHLLGEV